MDLVAFVIKDMNDFTNWLFSHMIICYDSGENVVSSEITFTVQVFRDFDVLEIWINKYHSDIV